MRLPRRAKGQAKFGSMSMGSSGLVASLFHEGWSWFIVEGLYTIA